ncbi:hypothetical protein IF1G_03576 [Cordyceps javanica]|uniref:Uncharacterized protein n=1 Tax=Cordyceps javanica TaxID=43265 RepID=A0A545V7Z7_9HYPO|nr:hypothetical protein IF1G_03576 [Cordyceps javanica]
MPLSYGADPEALGVPGGVVKVCDSSDAVTDDNYEKEADKGAADMAVLDQDLASSGTASHKGAGIFAGKTREVSSVVTLCLTAPTP